VSVNVTKSVLDRLPFPARDSRLGHDTDVADAVARLRILRDEDALSIDGVAEWASDQGWTEGEREAIIGIARAVEVEQSADSRMRPEAVEELREHVREQRRAES
jgi:hypothetical protein